MIEKLYQLGDDALANLWEMTIGPNPFLDDVESTVARIQNFDIPASGANKYENHYKTQFIEKVSGKPNITKEFSFTLRVDRNYSIYKGLVAWKNYVINTKTGVAAPDTPQDNPRTTFDVWPITPEGDKIPQFGTFHFEGGMVTNVDTLSFDYTSGDPLTVSVTVSFLNYDDTQI
jgi:hypothetical protein